MFIVEGIAPNGTIMTRRYDEAKEAMLEAKDMMDVGLRGVRLITSKGKIYRESDIRRLLKNRLLKNIGHR